TDADGGSGGAIGGSVTALGGGSGPTAMLAGAVRALAQPQAAAKREAAQPVARIVPAEPAPAAKAETALAFKPAGTQMKADAVTARMSEADKIAAARLRGYQGDACGECGNFTLVRNGTCLKCDTCGSTTGCS